jgi:A/G-specific adenine glycosylase
MLISSILTNWYLENKRELPWRNTGNPYHIWVSEVILQQTRVAQGLGYYQNFITSFPTVESLANAQIDDVLKVWQGLGYYSRARNLHEGAKYVVKQYQGILPAQFESLLTIKGIGEYTAAAISSIVYHIPVPVVDGNVNRVISRYFGVHDPINSSSGKKRIMEIARKILDKENPDLHNQAMMEFGALQCVTHNPNCDICPLKVECYALKHNEINSLPKKIKQAKVRKRYFNYIVILYHSQVVIRQRSGKDIWQGLYEFPLIETDSLVTKQELVNLPGWEAILKDSKYEVVNMSKNYIHQLTHQKIHASFLMVKVDAIPRHLINDQTFLIEKESIEQYPVSKMVENFLSTNGFIEFKQF